MPDESRTFGMEGMFRQLGIFSQLGQLYTPEDRDQLMFYREDKHGQVLQEGINEAGAMSSWIAAGTSYSNHGVPTIPFYIYYSMFGFQRVGDLAWAAGDSRTRGFLLGGTAGRTTLNGEGLQHEDGHSHLLSATIPNCVSYDPTYGFELAVIIREGLRRMITEQEDVFYYLTLMNENYQHPAMPEGAEEGILRGMYLLRGRRRRRRKVQLLGSGTILREVLAGAELLRDDFGVEADVWSVPSFTELRREGMEAERWNTLHPGEEPQGARGSSEQLGGRPGPVIAATDYMRSFADQIRPWVDAPVPRARHGRLRPLRLPQDAALVLRGGPPPRRAGGADRAGQDGRGRRRRAQEGDRVLRHRPRAARAVEGLREATVAGTEQVLVPDIGDFDDVPVIEVLVSVGDDGRRRGPAGRAGVRQGDDGGPVAGGRQGRGDRGLRRRQGQGGLADRQARGQRRQRRRRRRRAPAPSPRTDAPQESEDVEAAIQEEEQAAPRGRRRPAARAPPRRRPAPARRPPYASPARAPPGARARRRPRARSAGPAARAGSPRRTCRSRSRRRPRRRRAGGRPRSPAWTSPRGRRSTSSATARSSASR